MNPLGSSELSLTFLIACSMKATILLSFAWIAASAGCRRSASFRHLLWAVGIFGTLALPLVSLLLPGWHSSTLGKCRWILELSAHRSCEPQFTDIAFNDRRCAHGFPTVQQVSRLGPVAVDRRLIVRCNAAGCRSRAACMDIGALKAPH
jgi:hypothetical protein